MALFTPIADEFKVNDTNITVNTVTNPDVGVASDGTSVVVWEEPFQGNLDDIDIRGRRFFSNGTPVGDSFVITDSGDSDTKPAIAVAPDGSFVVTYVRDDDIYARIFDTDGFPAGSEILVSTFERDKEQFAPDIAIDPEGDFAVVWTHKSDNDDTDIRGRLFEADGTPITDDIAIADSDGNESEASLAAIPVANNSNSSDIFAGVVTFTSDINGDNDIFFSLYGNQGNELVVVPPVHAISDSNLEQNQRESSVAIDDNGDFVISWTNEFTSDDEDVVIRRFSADGNPINNLEIPVDETLGNQNQSQIALGTNGNIVVAYEDEVDDNVKYRQFNRDGQPLTDSLAYGVNSGVEKNPALAIGGNTLVITADDEQLNAFNPFARVFQDSLLTPINRFQNTDIPGTFLFAGEPESITIRRDFPNFAEEGFAFNVASQEGDDLIRINRFQNTDIPGTFLFAGEPESVNIRRDFPNFAEEGIAFYVYGADANKGIDYYRFQNKDVPGTYIFVDGQERDSILENFPQFELEGVAFEVG